MADHNDWIKQLFAAIDSMDAAKFSDFFTANARFIFGNNPPVIGKGMIKNYVAEFFGAIGGLSHRVDTIISNSDDLVCRGEVTYTRKDGSKLTVSFANYFKVDSGSTAHYQIYVDTSQLFQ
jgi:ketosteroid isomerase-like protein